MRVKLFLSGTLRRLAANEQEISLSKDARVADLINSLAKQYGAEFNKRIARQEMWQISINGHFHTLAAAMEAGLKNGDEVAIVPFIAGG